MSREYHIRVLDPKQDNDRFEIDIIKNGKVIATHKCEDTGVISKTIALTELDAMLNEGGENE